MTKIEKREGELKGDCLDEIDTQLGRLFFALQLQDVRKSGHPDIALNGFDKTTWWEFKHATPRFRSPEIQAYTCQRLAQRSYCRYVIYTEYGGNGRMDVRTAIYHPDEIRGCKGNLDGLMPEIEWRGLAHAHVANFMYLAHGGSGTLDSPDVLRRKEYR